MTSNSEARKRHEEPLITGDHEPSSMDYLKSEAERLPGGTAAKVLSALTLAAIDSDIRNSGSDTPPSVTKLDPDASFVTLTISRDVAEYFAERTCVNERNCFDEIGGCIAMDCQLEQACYEALEGER